MKWDCWHLSYVPNVTNICINVHGGYCLLYQFHLSKQLFISDTSSCCCWLSAQTGENNPPNISLEFFLMTQTNRGRIVSKKVAAYGEPGFKFIMLFVHEQVGAPESTLTFSPCFSVSRLKPMVVEGHFFLYTHPSASELMCKLVNRLKGLSEVKGLLCLQGNQKARVQLSNSSRVYASAEVNIKANLMLSSWMKRPVNVTLLISVLTCCGTVL